MCSLLRNKSFIPSISKLYLGADGLSDILFACKGDHDDKNLPQHIPAHKVILAAGSPVFRNTFFGTSTTSEDDTKKDSRDILMIEFGSVNAFKEFLQFFYLSEIILTMDNIGDVTRLADIYDMPDCVNVCVSFFMHNLTIEEIFIGYDLAIYLKNDELKQLCENLVMTKPLTIFKSNEFLNLDRNVLTHILKMNTLQCDEVDVFQACLAWAKHTCKLKAIDCNNKNLRSVLDDCFYLIRFSTMSVNEFTQSTMFYQEMFTRGELWDILQLLTKKGYVSKRFNHITRLKPSLTCDSKQAISCIRSGSKGHKYSIQTSESVWFSTNIALVLEEFEFINDNNNVPSTSIYDITIFEMSSTENESKTIFKATDCNDKRILLPKTLIMNPNKIYEIRVELFENHIYHTLKWKSESKLRATLGGGKGWISSLEFLRI